jgi:negative regulator of sigma E activity
VTHPHDFALLCDLLDGRLAPRAEDDLRRRLDEEPALRAEWDDLRRIRAGVRALATPALPADFAARVRAAAGAPVPAAPAGDVSPAATPPPVPAAPAAPEEGREGPVAAPPAGRLLRMRPALLAAAAAVVLAVGVGVLLATSPGRPEAGDRAETARREEPVLDREAWRSREADRTVARDGLGDALPPAGAPPPAVGVPTDGGVPTAGGGAPPAAAPGRFGPPGAIPPNLRTPRDASEPAPDPAASRPAAPAPEPAPTPTATAAAPKPAEVPKSKDGPDLAWAFAGVDDVLVIEAAGLEEGRARVAVLLADLRAAGPGTPDAGLLGKEKDEDRFEKKDEGRRPPPGKSVPEGEDSAGGEAYPRDRAAPVATGWKRLSRADAPRDADEQAAALRRAQDERRRAAESEALARKALEDEARAAREASGADAPAPPPLPPVAPPPPSPGAPPPAPAPTPAPEGAPAQGTTLGGADRRARAGQAAEGAGKAALGTFVLTLSPEEAARLDALLADPSPAPPSARGRAADAAERLVRVVVLPR